MHRKLQTLYSIKKEDLNDYLKKFLLINLIWFPIFCIYYLTSFVFYLLDTLKDRTSPSIGSVITYAFFLILIYFAAISYVFIQKHKTWKAIKITFKTGVLKIHYCILPYALLVIILLIWNVVFEKIALLNPYLAFVFALLIVLPTITLARILLGHTIQKL